jgi:two-component system, NarL family, sensor kinase
MKSMSETVPVRRLAWSLAGLSVLLAVAGLAGSLLVLVQSDSQGQLPPHLWFSPLSTVAFAVVGALVASRHPRNPIGWICSTVGVFIGLTLGAYGYSMAGQSGYLPLPGIEIARWLDTWLWIPATILPFTFLLLLFPDGRLPSARWRPIGWASGLGLAAYTVGIALHPNPPSELNPPPNPFGIPAATAALDLLVTLANILIAVGAVGSLAALVIRFRSSQGTERAQLKWLAYAGVVATLSNIAIYVWYVARPNDPLAYELTIIGSSAALITIVLAAGIAILRHQLYDIDLVINRTLVYGALTAAVAGIYLLVVGGLGVLLQARGSLALSLLGVGMVAIVVQPVRDRLQRAVNRLMYGERDDPYAVLSRLGQRLEAVLAPEAVLPALAETIAQALKLPYVAVALGSPDAGEPRIAAAYGLPASQALRLPLTYQSERVGDLIIAPRGPGETFTPAEQRLLGDIAHQAGVAVHAARLTADLQRSRERLVSALEEERRRLRRDLHDGLGPQLASQTLTLTAARQLLQSSPAQADALLAEAIKHAQAAVNDIRRVVYDLRPPALDDLGLAGALRAQAAEYEASGVHFRLSLPDRLPPLPAAVEVACYRIAQEALTNVVKHARAQNCALTLAVDGAVSLEVTDDGRGLPAERRAGVGLGSMRERAAELGGQCLIETGPAGGTRVLARLPIG